MTVHSMLGQLVGQLVRPIAISSTGHDLTLAREELTVEVCPGTTLSVADAHDRKKMKENEDGTFNIRFDVGGSEKNVPADKMWAPPTGLMDKIKKLIAKLTGRAKVAPEPIHAHNV